MPDLLGARGLHEVLTRHGVRPSKGLGQNFVIDPNTIRKVVEVAAVTTRDRVLEVGPGAGSLTLGLAGSAREVVAVEVDERLVSVLEETLGGVENVRVLHDDFLRVDLKSLGADAVVANLPYNIAVPVVMKVLEEAPQVSRLTVMTQREVGERLAAAPGSKTYGLPTVLAAYFSDVALAARISRRAFWPVPNVDSVLVRIDRRAPLDAPWPVYSAVARAAFSQRRKTVRNSLAASFGPAADGILGEAGISRTARPEDLDGDAFAGLARVAAAQGVVDYASEA